MAKLITKKEYRRRRRGFQIAAGLTDALFTVLAVVAAGICLLLIVSLARWLIDDVPVSFGVFFEVLERVLKVNA